MINLDRFKMDENTLAKTISEFSSEYDTCSRVLGLLSEGLSSMTGSKIQDDTTGIQISLCSRHFNSLMWSLELIAKGYLIQSLVLSRSALEDWIVAKYLSIKPEHTKIFSNIPKQPFEKPKRIPTFTAMMDAMDGNTRENAKETYSILSTFAHPRPIGIHNAYHRDDGQRYYHIGPYYEATNVRSGIWVWLQIAQVMFWVISDLHRRVIGSINTDWVSRGSTLTTEISAILDNIQNQAKKERGKD
jgi:hypothetical protein